MSPNPVTLLLHPNTRCDISATACAHRYQRVTVEVDGNTTTFAGGSSLNRLPMRLPDGRTEHYILDAKPYERTYTLKFESQNPDGSWRPSMVQDPVYIRRGSSMTYTLHAEDGEDGDYRDISLVLVLTP
ncbi:hypothetical protein RU639_003696 [Aspergillus parasiticus]